MGNLATISSVISKKLFDLRVPTDDMGQPQTMEPAYLITSPGALGIRLRELIISTNWLHRDWHTCVSYVIKT